MCVHVTHIHTHILPSSATSKCFRWNIFTDSEFGNLIAYLKKNKTQQLITGMSLFIPLVTHALRDRTHTRYQQRTQFQVGSGGVAVWLQERKGLMGLALSPRVIIC